MTGLREVITYSYVYGWLAASVLLVAPLMWLLPRRATGADGSIGFPKENRLHGLMLITAMMLIGIAMMAYYAFLERLAVRIDATAAQSGQIIAAAQISGMLGGLLAAPLAARFTLIMTLVTVVFVHMLCIFVAVFSSTFIPLLLAAFFEALMFIIMIPLMMTLSARIDREGRWAAAAAGIFVLSTALGPIIGAGLIEHTGYESLAWIQLIAAVPAAWLFTRVDRASRIGVGDAGSSPA